MFDFFFVSKYEPRNFESGFADIGQLDAPAMANEQLGPDSVGWVIFSISEARVKLPCVATAWNERRWA
jgi:hypothetical protein